MEVVLLANQIKDQNNFDLSWSNVKFGHKNKLLLNQFGGIKYSGTNSNLGNVVLSSFLTTFFCKSIHNNTKEL